MAALSFPPALQDWAIPPPDLSLSSAMIDTKCITITRSAKTSAALGTTGGRFGGGSNQLIKLALCLRRLRKACAFCLRVEAAGLAAAGLGQPKNKKQRADDDQNNIYGHCPPLRTWHSFPHLALPQGWDFLSGFEHCRSRSRQQPRSQAIAPGPRRLAGMPCG
jgi:hypothetical protein